MKFTEVSDSLTELYGNVRIMHVCLQQTWGHCGVLFLKLENDDEGLARH